MANTSAIYQVKEKYKKGMDRHNINFFLYING